jgi:hypothetical protein
MNQNVKTSLGVAIIIIIAFTVGVFPWKAMNVKESVAPVTDIKIKKVSTNSTKAVDQKAPADETANKESEIKSIDSNWNQYTNYQLGFTLKIPKRAVFAGNSADVVSYKAGNIDYIYPNFKNDKYYEDFINQLKNPSLDEFGKVAGIPWAILVENVKNDGELLKFIQNRYGTGCKLGKKEIIPSGDYKIVIESDGLDPEVSKCFLNYALSIKYNPVKEKVAAWDIGQGPNFFVTSDKSVDNEMDESFQFIK